MKKTLCAIVIAGLFFVSNTVQAKDMDITQKVSNMAIGSKLFNSEAASIDSLVGKSNNKIRIIFTDVDGTLIKLSTKNFKLEPSKDLKNTVKLLHKANLPLVLTTGRSFKETSDVAKAIGNENMYMIVLNGSEIRNPSGQIIYQDVIKNSEAAKIIENIYEIIKRHNLTTNVVVYSKGIAYSTVKFKLPFNWEDIKIVKSYRDLGENAPVNKILIDEKNPEVLNMIYTELKEHFPNYSIYLSNNRYCEIQNYTATKGCAVKKLASMLRMDMKNTAVFGDAQNDITMFNQVERSGGIAIAVGNAVPELKENANYYTDSVDNDGFSKAVDKILRNNLLLDKKKLKPVKNNKVMLRN